MTDNESILTPEHEIWKTMGFPLAMTERDRLVCVAQLAKAKQHYEQEIELLVEKLAYYINNEKPSRSINKPDNYQKVGIMADKQDRPDREKIKQAVLPLSKMRAISMTQNMSADRELIADNIADELTNRLLALYPDIEEGERNEPRNK